MGYFGGIHRSKEFWSKPDEFYPEHFLDENGTLRKHVEGYLPFSTGVITLKDFVELNELPALLYR